MHAYFFSMSSALSAFVQKTFFWVSTFATASFVTSGIGNLIDPRYRLPVADIDCQLEGVGRRPRRRAHRHAGRTDAAFARACRQHGVTEAVRAISGTRLELFTASLDLELHEFAASGLCPDAVNSIPPLGGDNLGHLLTSGRRVPHARACRR